MGQRAKIGAASNCAATCVASDSEATTMILTGFVCPSSWPVAMEDQPARENHAETRVSNLSAILLMSHR